MHNDGLTRDYLRRSKARLGAARVLVEAQSWADLARESQEIVEIALKALLRAHRIEVPRIHGVSPVLEQNRVRFGRAIQESPDELMRISRLLRRDRELVFYGSEDPTPSEFYREEDAQQAYTQARFVCDTVSGSVS